MVLADSGLNFDFLAHINPATIPCHDTLPRSSSISHIHRNEREKLNGKTRGRWKAQGIGGGGDAGMGEIMIKIRIRIEIKREERVRRRVESFLTDGRRHRI
jgi:hypothetical protein